ncbi:MAG: 16S rRNA (cytidine(1402)-2'-O)-methyltransferase [Gammaproteobacteria bacterium TMED119]|nr:MAG: 16S rRNA (cytidine(1402)-2'-O)-methyltransferase [Gammaproteobacteria bacterium TMED119]RCL46965.1 MAG: 16S rRNA (cytidine(1402)-2'-O)-methyltransferase [Candidatus Thioglobus sp.]
MLTGCAAKLNLVRSILSYFWISTLSLLYIVATPIGNLKDITLRALGVLAEVDLILAEDTRVTQKLLTVHGIKKSLLSYHQHNAEQRDPQVLTKLAQGHRIALVTDAGTPLISDPGHSLVARCRQNNIQVIPVPGASAAITALSVNDFNVSRFSFEGYLAPKQTARRQQLARLALNTQATILYETKHRIIEVLEDIRDTLGAERRIMLARELTKVHEQIVSASVGEIVQQLHAQVIPCLGEFVILLQGDSGAETTQLEINKMRILFECICPLMSHRAAVELARTQSSLAKNLLYELAAEYYHQS